MLVERCMKTKNIYLYIYSFMRDNANYVGALTHNYVRHCVLRYFLQMQHCRIMNFNLHIVEVIFEMSLWIWTRVFLHMKQESYLQINKPPVCWMSRPAESGLTCCLTCVSVQVRNTPMKAPWSTTMTTSSLLNQVSTVTHSVHSYLVVCDLQDLLFVLFCLVNKHLCIIL